MNTERGSSGAGRGPAACTSVAQSCCSIDKLIEHRSFSSLFYEGEFTIIKISRPLGDLKLDLQQKRHYTCHFYTKMYDSTSRRGGDVHFLIARLYITSLD